MAPDRIQVILFDLGNVIFPFSHTRAAEKMRAFSPLPTGEIFRRIFESELEARFDRGLLSPEEFHRELKQALSLDMDYPVFVDAWNDIFSLNEEVEDLIHRLKYNRYPVYVLSNTNALHINHLRKTYPFLGSLDGFFLSFELGVRKPDRRIFESAVSGIDVPARAIAFTDDKPEFISAADETGLRAILFRNARELERSLRKLGVEPGVR